MPAQPTVQQIAVANIQFNRRKKFSFQPDEWLRWIRRFERMRKATGLDQKDGESQLNTLISLIAHGTTRVLQRTSSCTLSQNPLVCTCKLTQHLPLPLIQQVNSSLPNIEEGQLPKISVDVTHSMVRQERLNVLQSCSHLAILRPPISVNNLQVFKFSTANQGD